MNYDLHVAIPTFNRPKTLINKTLKLLADVPDEYITIYVEDEIQECLYKTNLSDKYKIVKTHTKGIGKKRNKIKSLNTARWLFQIDDDISDIIDIDNNKLTSNQVWELIITSFKECEEIPNCRLWGIAGYSNHFFLKDSISTNLKFICGNFHGTITNNYLEHVLTPIDLMEDYYNTLEHYTRDGCVMRNNGFGTKTRFAKEAGGLQTFYSSDERVKNEKINALWLKEKYGNMCRLIEKERGVDLRLNHRY
jgi:hypothetical protein